MGHDLGGPDKVSVQQLAIVDITVRTYLFLEHIDHWLLNKPSIINKQKRKLFDIAVQIGFGPRP